MSIDATVIEGPNGTSPVAGDPVLINGYIPGTALATKDSVTGLTPVVTAPHIAEFVVTGVKASGNAIIAAGDPVYMQTTGVLNGDAGGIPFGFAFGNSLAGSSNKLGVDTRTGTLVASAATTTTIRVLVGLLPRRGTFVSVETTGTGSSQLVAHGLGVAPTAVLVVPTDTSPSTAGVFTVVEGTHTATDVVLTVTSGKKFKVLAFV